MQEALFQTTPKFDGETFDEAQDGARLSGQLAQVKNLMADGEWRTLAHIARVVNSSEAGASARLRDLRKQKFGAYTVERRRKMKGLWEYRLKP